MNDHHKISLEKKRKIVLVSVAIVLTIAMVLLVAAYIEKNSGIPFEILGSTDVIVEGASSVADVGAGGVVNPDKLSLPRGVGRFDMVTFDIPAISNKLKSGQGFPISVRGKMYFANISSVRVENNDEGIVTYAGKFPGEKDYNLILTVGPDIITGIVIFNGEYFTIGRAEKSSRPEYNSSPLHYIYSEKDIGPFPAWIPSGIRHPFNSLYRLTPMGHQGGLCGGKFEIYKVLDDKRPDAALIVLTEKDFSDFPELDAVIRGGLNSKATCYNGNDQYSSCIGGGHFGCNEETLVGKYADFTHPPDISGSGVPKYLEYAGKYYKLRITQIS